MGLTDNNTSRRVLSISLCEGDLMTLWQINLLEAAKQKIITWPDFFRLWSEGEKMESEKPTRDHLEARLLEAKNEAQVLETLEKTMFKNLLLAVELREYGHVKALGEKLEQNFEALELAYKTVRMIQDDIELDKRMGIY